MKQFVEQDRVQLVLPVQEKPQPVSHVRLQFELPAQAPPQFSTHSTLHSDPPAQSMLQFVASLQSTLQVDWASHEAVQLPDVLQSKLHSDWLPHPRLHSPSAHSTSHVAEFEQVASQPGSPSGQTRSQSSPTHSSVVSALQPWAPSAKPMGNAAPKQKTR